VRRPWVCVLLIVMCAVTSYATPVIWTARVEINGRLLVPVRGVFESLGAVVEWNPAEEAVTINDGTTFIAMWVGSSLAMVNGYEVQLDVPAQMIGGARVYIPLRFVGEALGSDVEYLGDRVVISSMGGVDLIIMLGGSAQPPPPPPPPTYANELLPQSNDRHLTAGDLAGLTNWQLTLARNEIYARHGRPFQSANIRAYFQSTGWYTPNPSFQESWLSKLEAHNAVFIREYQEQVFGRPATSP